MAKKQAQPKYKSIADWISDQPAEMRKSLRDELSKLKKAFSPARQKDPKWNWRVGRHVSAFFPDRKRHYGADVMTLLARAMPRKDSDRISKIRNLLRQARSIAEHFSQNDLDAWSKRRNVRGLSPSAYDLYVVADLEPEVRTELLETWHRENWAHRDLRAAAQNAAGGKRSRGRSIPKERTPPRPRVALQDIELAAMRWLEQHETWFGGAGSSLHRVLVKEQTPELLDDLEAAAEALKSLKAAVDEELKQLRKLASTVRQRASRRT